MSEIDARRGTSGASAATRLTLVPPLGPPATTSVVRSVHRPPVEAERPLLVPGLLAAVVALTAVGGVVLLLDGAVPAALTYWAVGLLAVAGLLEVRLQDGPVPAPAPRSAPDGSTTAELPAAA